MKIIFGVFGKNFYSFFEKCYKVILNLLNKLKKEKHFQKIDITTKKTTEININIIINK